MKVSVIIPFYKVAPFIRRCAVSLLEQTLGEVNSSLSTTLLRTKAGPSWKKKSGIIRTGMRGS